MSKLKAEGLSQHPAYAHGYRAGVKKVRDENRAVIEALTQQVELWRDLAQARGVDGGAFAQPGTNKPAKEKNNAARQA